MKSLLELYESHDGKVSDRWSLYLTEYDRLFKSYRELPISLLEIGVQNGGSLEIWSQYFANGIKFVGCDINPDCQKLTYDDPRIAVIVGDATTSETQKKIYDQSATFDLIIEDGSHTSGDIVKAFARYFPVLKDEGLFVAEDLHCSYWQEFEGGIFHPYSSMNFFKHLADIINHEHWGIDRDRTQLLSGFKNQYQIDFDEDLLSQIQSIEFINSICIIRKSESKKNLLGKRFISGKVEDVVGGHCGLHAKVLVAESQKENIYSNLNPPIKDQAAALQNPLENNDPGFSRSSDEIDGLNQEIGKYHHSVLEKNALIDFYENFSKELKAKVDANEVTINTYISDVNELKQEIGKYHHAVLERDRALELILNSFSWKITKWMRALKNGCLLFCNKYKKYKLIFCRHSSAQNFKKIFNIFRTQGFNGVIKRIKLEIQKSVLKYELEGLAVHLNRKTVNYFPQILNNESWEPPKITVDIIIPVYRGLNYTKNCINSIIASRAKVNFRVIVINDCSPESDLVEYLSTLEVTESFIVLSNAKNLGFVGTVNRGMAISGVNDVLLLNSDAEVPDYFLDALVWHAYHSERKVATVTPFTNNGTICSFPTINGASKLPLDAELNWINGIFSRVNKHRSVELPTGVGFCMYIRRDALKEIGMFDEEAFGKGYGEENDFCIKANLLGWKNLLAVDTFVFHAGEVSFQEDSSPGKIKAMKILRDRHPYYEGWVAEHIMKAEADPFRVAAAGGLFLGSGRPTVLIISHSLGGGTEKHWLEVIDKYKNEVNFVILKPSIDHQKLVSLGLFFDEGIINTNIDWVSEYNFLLDLIKSFGISRVHVHHLLGIEILAEKLINDLKIPFDFTLHDYFTICPKVNLMSGGQYCEELGIKQCNSCIARDTSINPNEIIAWRNKFAWVVQDASRVICPSNDSYQRLKRYHPFANAIVVKHEELQVGAIRENKKQDCQKINIVILGILAEHKGLKRVSEVLSLIKGSNLHINLIGSSNGALSNSKHYSESGVYLDHDLPNLLEHYNPDLIWFPAVWPETYSYTLSAAISGGYRVLAPNLGAFKERLADYHSGKIYQYDINNFELITIIKEFCKVE